MARTAGFVEITEKDIKVDDKGIVTITDKEASNFVTETIEARGEAFITDTLSFFSNTNCKGCTPNQSCFAE